MWGFGSFKPLGEVGSIKMKVFTYLGYTKFFVQSSTPSLSMPPRLTEHGDFCMQNSQLETKTQVELTDNSNILSGFSNSSRLCPLPDSMCSSGPRKKKEAGTYSGVRDWVLMMCCVNNRDLHGNGLSGDIPAELSQSQYLTYLWAFSFDST